MTTAAVSVPPGEYEEIANKFLRIYHALSKYEINVQLRAEEAEFEFAAEALHAVFPREARKVLVNWSTQLKLLSGPLVTDPVHKIAAKYGLAPALLVLVADLLRFDRPDEVSASLQNNLNKISGALDKEAPSFELGVCGLGSYRFERPDFEMFQGDKMRYSFIKTIKHLGRAFQYSDRGAFWGGPPVTRLIAFTSRINGAVHKLSTPGRIQSAMWVSAEIEKNGLGEVFPVPHRKLIISLARARHAKDGLSRIWSDNSRSGKVAAALAAGLPSLTPGKPLAELLRGDDGEKTDAIGELLNVATFMRALGSRSR